MIRPHHGQELPLIGSRKPLRAFATLAEPLLFQPAYFDFLFHLREVRVASEKWERMRKAEVSLGWPGQRRLLSFFGHYWRATLRLMR